jgi:hypothetical protein
MNAYATQSSCSKNNKFENSDKVNRGSSRYRYEERADDDDDEDDEC